MIAADKKNKEELTKNGFNVLYPSFTNHADMKKSIAIMADAIGGDAPKIAQKFNDYFDQNLQKVLSKTSKIAQNERPKVLHIAEGKNLFKVDGSNTIIDEWISVAGGTNAVQANGNMLEINAEEIPNINPAGVFSWDRYGAEGALQILWAAKTLHPEIFKDLDIAAETKKFYKEFLHYDLNDNEVNYILNGLDPEGK